MIWQPEHLKDVGDIDFEVFLLLGQFRNKELQL